MTNPIRQESYYETMMIFERSTLRIKRLKRISLILALTLIISMFAFPAMAAEGTTDGQWKAPVIYFSWDPSEMTWHVYTKNQPEGGAIITDWSGHWGDTINTPDIPADSQTESDENGCAWGSYNWNYSTSEIFWGTETRVPGYSTQKLITTSDSYGCIYSGTVYLDKTIGPEFVGGAWRIIAYYSGTLKHQFCGMR